MTIERRGSNQILVCDCGEEHEEFHRADFGEMIAAAKRDGWQIVQERGEWVHRCPTCRDEPETPLQRAQRMFGRS